MHRTVATITYKNFTNHENQLFILINIKTGYEIINCFFFTADDIVMHGCLI